MILIFLAYVGTSFSQTNGQIDQRLKTNHGESINRIFEKQKSYYDFLVWELNKGYEIVDMTTLDLNVVDVRSVQNISNSNGETFKLELLEMPKVFNFIDFNFKREKQTEVYYDLENGTVIMFYSLRSVWNNYKELK